MGLTKIRAQQISDIDYKQAVRVITLSNITLSGGAPSLVDGVSLQAGNRVLVNGQDDAAQNGLYVVQTLGTGSNGTWVRTSDGNEDGEILSGMIVMVTEGDEYADTPWKLVTNGTIVIGVTPLIFEENYSLAFGNIFANGTAVVANTVSAPITFTAGNNISITGNNTAKSVTIAVTDIITANTGNFGILNLQTGVSSNLLPTANVTFNLGSLTSRWNDLFLSNSTIYVGNGTISANSTKFNIVNPDGTVFSSGGGGGGGSPGGSNTMIQFNFNDTFLGTAALTWNGLEFFANGTANITGNITGANITGSGNITGNYILGNGSQLTGIDATSIQNGTANVRAFLDGNVTVSAAGTANVMTVTSTGANVTGTITATGNVSGGNIIQGGTRVFKYFVSNTAPTFAEPGDAWFRPAGNTLYNYLADGDSNQWVETLGVSLPASSTSASANTIAQRDTNASLTANIFIGQATSAQYADLAENYVSDRPYAPGTVVIIGGDREITQSTQDHDTRVAGVISTAPAYHMNSACDGLPVALTGRVPCMVIGPVGPGDLLVSSSVPGHAQAMDPAKYQPGCVIGKSLETLPAVPGRIEILVGRF